MPTSGPNSDPVFVVGFPRSGTTLLQALIGAHPRIAAAPELHFLRRIWSLAADWGDLDDDTVLRRVVTETVQPPTGYLDDAGFDVERIVERVRSGPRSYAAVLDATLRDFADREGKPRWSEKSPRQLPRAVWRLMPRAKAVHIVRDPRETVVSAARKLGRYPDVVAAAQEWREFTTAAMTQGSEQGPGQYLRIRYEDLARDPAATMRLVFAFLGESWDPATVTDLSRRRAAIAGSTLPWMAEALEAVRAPTVDTWRAQTTALQRARVAALVGDLLPGLGYAPVRSRAVALGRVVNAAYSPADRLRERRRRRILRGLRTPEARYEYARGEQRRLAVAGTNKVRNTKDS